MTGRTRNAVRGETDVEKFREESKWKRLVELAEQLKQKSPELECLSNFLIGEAKLESYLEEYPPVEANAHRAKVGLVEAKRYLHLARGEIGKKEGISLDANLLLGKLHYACTQYSDSLRCLSELQNVSEKKLPLRSLRIVAESFAIRGLCLEYEAPASSKFKQAERDAEMIRCFNLASDLGLLYMQELQKLQTTVSATATTGSHSPLPPSNEKTLLGPILETAIQKAPAVALRMGKLSDALDRYRNTLSAVEANGTHNVRLKLMRQLAELLLRGAGGIEYRPPVGSPSSVSKETVWKPKHYASLNQFVPRNECEEVILVLLIAEAMAARDAVLSQSPEFKEERIRTYQNASSIYDLLAVACVRWGQVSLLQESLEHAMKFSFQEPHVWEQHALSLMAMGRYIHSLLVLKEAIKLQPNKTIPCLLASRICYEHLNMPAEGLKWSQEARSRDLSRPHGLLGRCYLYMGIGYNMQASQCINKEDKVSYSTSALEAFQKAVQIEPNDHLCEYYLGWQLALNGCITEALAHVRTALALRPESSSTLHVLSLLLSASHQHDEALQLIRIALEEYPDCLNLLYVKAHLELHQNDGEASLATAKHMLHLWKRFYEGQTISDVPECDRKSDTRSVFQLYTSEMSDKDSSSLQAHSVAASRVEQALSEVASSLSSFNPRPGPQRSWLLQLQIWLLLAELYLSLDQLGYVQQCIQEATQIYPLSHHIMHTRGLMHMHKKEWNEAKMYFQNAVAIDPQYVKSLQQLGLVYHYLGQQRLAETTLRDAAKIEPNNHITWYNLGKVLESLGECEAASDCMATALIVETTSPVLPFNSIALCFE